MATINRKPIRQTKVKPVCSEAFNSASFYNSMAWHRLRNVYISEHPICYECLQHKHVVPAEHIHHLKKFSCGTTEEEQWTLFLDINNLRSLCEKCHTKYHIKMNRYGLDRIDGLTDKEYEEDI